MNDNPLADLGIDLSGLLADPAATVQASSDSVNIGLESAASAAIGGGLEVELGATEGIPYLSVEGEGGVVAEGAVAAEGSYDSADVASGPAGTSVAVDSVDGAIAGYGGVEAGGAFDVDVYGVPGGGAGLDVDVAADYAAETDFGVEGSHDHYDIGM
ncbi:hypothetical protein [Rhodococcus sp. HNM0569]|uniref:hypothetical protein n=1 Tax=Rhodococcus sp. HNM0569 TaxID=2716340 RepID=UPI00146D360B|nr:hypothetical protein [Rhodococcus sp. HNM0569]NLU83415.1 hypothetical protein [Rhodococcus sp. HNM0569]